MQQQDIIQKKNINKAARAEKQKIVSVVVRAYWFLKRD